MFLLFSYSTAHLASMCFHPLEPKKQKKQRASPLSRQTAWEGSEGSRGRGRWVYQSGGPICREKDRYLSSHSSPWHVLTMDTLQKVENKKIQDDPLTSEGYEEEEEEEIFVPALETSINIQNRGCLKENHPTSTYNKSSPFSCCL